MRKAAGFTLIEALVVITITGILLGVLLANYRRSNENSLLIRETASVMSYIRLAQETAASGEVLGSFCENALHTGCVNDGTCTPLAGDPKKCVAKPPAGGEVMLFSCNTQEAFSHYGDSYSCTGDCFKNNPTGTLNAGDSIITDPEDDGLTQDIRRSITSLSPGVRILDLQLTGVLNDGSMDTYSCEGDTPWIEAGCTLPGVGGLFSPPPMQIALQFTSEGLENASNIGRKLVIHDNAKILPPEPGCTNGKYWDKAEIMVGLANRETDCRVVTITRNNVMTESVDADCEF